MEEHVHAVIDEPPVTGEQMAEADAAPPVRRRLGRGLSALLGGEDERQAPAPAEDLPSELRQVAVDAIDRNPFQPREDFDDSALDELAESIRQRGVLQPVLLRPHEGRFQLIAGERRWLAARRAGLQCVPCRILELDDRQVSEAAIEENLKRQDLGALEKAQAFRVYLDRFGGTLEELSQRLGMNRSTVSNYVRLLELPEPVKQALRDERISFGHARSLLALEDEAGRIALCERIVGESLSVRKTEAAVRSLRQAAAAPSEEPPGDADAPEEPHRTNHVRSLEDRLRETLGAKVQIQLRSKEAGRIVVHFHSNDEFERILEQLRPAA